MLSSIRNRLILIALLAAGSVWSLLPRDVSVRRLGADGRMRDSVERRTPLKRGLDLQGGIRLALEIDQSKGVVPDPEDALGRALEIIRQRINEFGVSEPSVQQVGDNRIVVELAGETDPARAKSVVQRSAFLEFRITDMQGQFRDAIPRIDAVLRRAGVAGPAAAGAVSAVSQLLQADTAQPAEDSTQVDSLDLNTPGVLSGLLYQGSVEGEYLVPEERYLFVDSLIHLPDVQREVPRGLELFWGAEARSQGATSYRPLYAVDRRAIITGDQLSDASATIDQLTQGAIVIFQLTRAGGRRFGRETGQHVNDNMAIILDGRVQGTPPVIQQQINRRGQIELGNANLQQARDLALILRAGALPAPLVIVEERTVGPNLGHDSITQGTRAIVVGAILVVLIVVGYYRFAGLLAVGALGMYALFTFGGLALFEFTLTLPGLAGFVLSVGMAVDANVLIFERIREELAQNKTPRGAVDAGFEHAMPAIIDSNITTVMTALFLFQFGTGPVRGFALTLITGIVASFITAVFVTRTFFLIWLQRRSLEKEFAL
ncbi:MAG TPA: protein translocase subunit SecD [Gemmatimonadales bacterium]